LLIAALGLAPAGRVAAQSFTNLHSLSPVDVVNGYTNNDGANPYAALVLSGNTLYGTAAISGPGDGGTVFAVKTDGTGFTNLYAFDHDASFNYTNGSGPEGSLALSGNTLYGTAVAGGSSGNGVVYAVNTDGTGFTNLHSFTAPTGFTGPYGTNSDGAEPQDALTLSGNALYGTTQVGGTNSYGTIFAVNTDGSGFTVLHHFAAAAGTTGTFGANSDGFFPRGSLVLSGNTLYGTAIAGGTNGYGTVFAVNTDGSGFTTLHTFTAPDPTYLTNRDGNRPFGGLVVSGNTLYGRSGGGASLGFGAVFVIHTDGTGFTNVYAFTNSFPVTVGSSGLLLSGNTLYGTTSLGGNSGKGVVFAVNTDGTGFATLHTFTPDNGATNSDGANPYGGVILSGGILYGTTQNGGAFGNGTVFALNPTSPTPAIQFTASPTSGTVPLSVQFNAPSYDNGGNLLTHWNWNFGDGGTSTNQNPLHVYYVTGSYSPALVMTNNLGGMVSGAGPSITVSPPMSAIEYTASPTNGTAPLMVQFNAPGTDDAGYAVSSWNWDFGDGGTSTSQNPSHVYNIAGSYSPTLTAGNVYGGTDSGYGPSISVAQSPSGGHTNVAYYSFEDDSIFAHDYSGNGNDINGVSYFGGAANEPYMTNDAAAGSYAVGYTGAGWQDPPTNLVATLAGSFSVSLWARSTAHPGSDSDAGGSGQGLLAANTDLAIPMALTGSKLAFQTGGGIPDTLHSTTSINTGSYVHLVVTRDQGTGEKKIYVNGNLDASDVGSAGQLSTGSNPSLYLGENTSFSGGVVGEMDEVQIYSGVLSSNEVAYLYEHPGTNVADVVGQGVYNGINIVSNGGFETGDFSGWTLLENDGSVFVDDGYNLGNPPHSGNYVANFGTEGALDYISQTLTTTPGTTYLLSFWLDSPDGATPNELQVSWDGNTVFDETDIPAIGWTNIQLLVTAAETSTVLKFGGQDDPGYLGLDDVSVVSTTAAPPAPVSVSFNLQIQRYQDFTYGYTSYDAYPDITFIDPAPVTTNIVISPDGFMFSEVWAGDSYQDNGSGEGFNSLDDLIYACTNGQWTLYVNKGDPGQQVFHFNVSVNGLTTDNLTPVKFLVPAPNSVNVPTNSPLQWSGPANYSSVFVEAYQEYPAFAFDGYTSLPADATNWPSPPALLAGTNYFYVSYSSNNFPNVTFTTPVNGSLNTVSNWDTEVDLFSVSFMSFVVDGSGPLPALLIPSLQQAGGNFQVSFQTQAGRPETIQTTTNLTSPWVDVTNFTGDGSIRQFTFPTANSLDEYFRVMTQ